MARVRLLLICVIAFAVLVCGLDAASNLGTSQAAANGASTDPGSLISMSIDSQVGVLLDEIPAGTLRDAAAANALAQGADFWTARAARQTKLAYYRLVFRGEFYPNFKNNQKGPLPLPDKSKWNILLTGPAHRVTTADGHHVVARPYNMNTYIVADATSP